MTVQMLGLMHISLFFPLFMKNK